MTETGRMSRREQIAVGAAVAMTMTAALVVGMGIILSVPRDVSPFWVFLATMAGIGITVVGASVAMRIIALGAQ